MQIKEKQEEYWIEVYGFSPADKNLVLQEFEKCGLVSNHVFGPDNNNNNTKWLHICYRSRSDAQKALDKNGMQIKGDGSTIGVKNIHDGGTRMISFVPSFFNLMLQRARGLVLGSCHSTINYVKDIWVGKKSHHLMTAGLLLVLAYIARDTHMGNDVFKELEKGKRAREKELAREKLTKEKEHEKENKRRMKELYIDQQESLQQMRGIRPKKDPTRQHEKWLAEVEEEEKEFEREKAAKKRINEANTVNKIN